MHIALPDASEYVPTPHGTHDPIEVAPDVPEYIPTAHGVHTNCPGAELYVPALHIVHVDAAGVEEYVPALQFVQTELDVAPNTVEYWPMGHGEHDAPARREYVPAAQAVHFVFA